MTYLPAILAVLAAFILGLVLGVRRRGEGEPVDGGWRELERVDSV